MTQDRLSQLTGIDQALISKYVRGVQRPQLDNAFAIEDATKGAVPARTWRRRRRTPPARKSG
jgi:hypothetical protein